MASSCYRACVVKQCCEVLRQRCVMITLPYEEKSATISTDTGAVDIHVCCGETSEPDYGY
jgi:hypothetical protein